MMKRYYPLALGAWLFACVAAAQGAGDVDAGKAKSALCVACHGTDGNSTNPEWPNIAGQHPEYLVQQLKNFKSGTRANALMAGIAAALSEQDMANLAAYFAAQQPKVTGVSDMKRAKEGERLYRGGYAKMAVAACMSCHGPRGLGIPPRFPRVSGQHAAYTEKQLLAYKAGERSSEIMMPIAFRLSAEQIKAVAQYMAGLH